MPKEGDIVAKKDTSKLKQRYVKAALQDLHKRRFRGNRNFKRWCGYHKVHIYPTLDDSSTEEEAICLDTDTDESLAIPNDNSRHHSRRLIKRRLIKTPLRGRMKLRERKAVIFEISTSTDKSNDNMKTDEEVEEPASEVAEVVEGMGGMKVSEEKVTVAQEEEKKEEEAAEEDCDMSVGEHKEVEQTPAVEQTEQSEQKVEKSAASVAEALNQEENAMQEPAVPVEKAAEQKTEGALTPVEEQAAGKPNSRVGTEEFQEILELAVKKVKENAMQESAAPVEEATEQKTEEAAAPEGEKEKKEKEAANLVVPVSVALVNGGAGKYVIEDSVEDYVRGSAKEVEQTPAVEQTEQSEQKVEESAAPVEKAAEQKTEEALAPVGEAKEQEQPTDKSNDNMETDEKVGKPAQKVVPGAGRDLLGSSSSSDSMDVNDEEMTGQRPNQDVINHHPNQNPTVPDQTPAVYDPDRFYVGPYYWERNLGSGAFGQVFSALHVNTGRRVAVKRISVRNGNAREDAESELTVLKLIGQSPLLEFIGAYEDQDYFYIITELAGTGSLVDHIEKNGGGWKEDDARAIFKQLVSAVEFMHVRDFSHNDISAGNIMIRVD